MGTTQRIGPEILAMPLIYSIQLQVNNYMKQHVFQT